MSSSTRLLAAVDVRRVRWWLLPAGLAGLGLVVFLGWRLFSQGADLATVLGLLATIAGVVATVVLGVVQIRDARDPTRIVAEGKRLAEGICTQEWRALEQLMADSGEVQTADVEFRQSDKASWRTDGGAPSGTLSNIGAYYRTLDRGRLVVLGPAGSGKTVLAIRLVLDIATCGSQPSAVIDSEPLRIPVRLSAAAFEPLTEGQSLDTVTAEELSDRLDAWIAGEVRSFGLSRRSAYLLVQEGTIVPVLDGIDEMDPDAQNPRQAEAS